MGIVAVLPKIFIIFSAFRPFFRTFRWSPRPCGCEDARRWRHSLGIQSLYIYIIYICVYIAVWVVSSCAQLLKKHCVGLDTETCGRRQWRPETLDG
jgi:hypothetical protein